MKNRLRRASAERPGSARRFGNGTGILSGKEWGMCLAVPVRVVSIQGTTAVVDAGGNLLKADLSLVDGVGPGDYVILHAGFAIQKYSPEEAEETLRLFREIEEKAAKLEGKASRKDEE
jgi:hydrogenase expression/formation protein HypC